MRPVFILPLTGLVGCAFLSPLPDLRTPADHAREYAGRCAGVTEASSAPAMLPESIDSVEAAYSHVPTGNGSEQRLQGVRLHLRPFPGVTKQSLERSLECHESSVALGLTRAVANDPYVLPRRWVDVDIDTDADGFVAIVRSDALADARSILARARRFAVRTP